MQKEHKDLISNRRTLHDYEVLDTYEAGIVLQGTEIKSLRQHEGSLQESYVRPLSGEILLIGAYIPYYKYGNIYNHEERRDRKLLLHKREILKLQSAVQEKGLTIIALGLYLKNGRAKIRLAIARGKKLVDKRQDLKNRDQQREVQKMMKNY